MLYLDFDIEVREQDSSHCAIAVRSQVGEARTTILFPFTNVALETELLKVENAILRSAGGRRKNPTPEETAVQVFGQKLFEFLLSGELLSLYRQCQQLADAQNRGVRIKLNVLPPGLAALPWEFLYDSRRRDYLCLDPNTSLVRYLELSEPIRPVTVTAPLRILGVCINAVDLGGLDVAEEQRRMNEAVRGLQAQGLVELTWLEGQTGDDLLRAMRSGPWHILHFIGHGSFDVLRDEGMIILADEQGRAAPLAATQLARLLQRQRGSLRLVLLNACEGARGGRQDLFSSTAATLVGSGIPAVLAMQYEVTDGVAIQLARTFYEALAHNLPVDAAVVDARDAISRRNRHSLEWATPVLYMRSPDGQLFALAANTETDSNPTSSPIPPPAQPKPQPAKPATQSVPPMDKANFDNGTPTDEQASADDRQAAKIAERATPTAPPARRRIQIQSPIDFDWVRIPAGEFVMGSDKAKDKSARDNEMPQHRLYLPEYRIARVPVTNAQYQQFVRAKGYTSPSHWEKGQIPAGKANHPVVRVSWQDALAFCAWAGVRLPSEAEWEKAARGTDRRIWPWGNEVPDKERCNFNRNVSDTTAVGNYPKGASPYGVLDMAGNVWEWTSSLFKDYPYKPDDGREDSTNAASRVVRGGSFGFDGYRVRCACRDRYDPDGRHFNIGFRVMSPGS